MKLPLIKNKNKGLPFIDLKSCGFCGSKKSVRKHVYYFSGNRKGYVCCPCALKFPSSDAVSTYLASLAVYGPTGKLIGFRRGKK